jgi:SAM-dependent methyltransferase
MNNEAENIKRRYQERKVGRGRFKESIPFINNVVAERERVYQTVIGKHFGSFKDLKLLEIGAGEGVNIDFFIKNGLVNKNIVVTELLPERIQLLKNQYPEISVMESDSSDLEFENNFDIVFQSLVFTSILDKGFKLKVAQQMFRSLKPFGIILWYDFKFNNPANTNVKGINKREIAGLFPDAKKIEFKNVTLAPPIGRKVGRYYHVINWLFPFLRSHLIAVIYK